jgi:hypothetical protein
MGCKDSLKSQKSKVKSQTYRSVPMFADVKTGQRILAKRLKPHF